MRWLLLCCAFSGWTAAESAEISPIGRKIDGFELHDHLGAKRSLEEWKDAPAVVVVFTGTQCPVAKLYASRLNELARRFKRQGVQFVAVNSNQHDTLVEIGHFIRTHDLTIPVLKDPGNRVADQFGAVRTPEAFILDRERRIRYWGRIDDQYGVGYSRAEPAEHYLANALRELLAEKPVSRAVVESVGCHISRVDREEPTGEITYTKHIAPILNQHCVKCHRAGEIAPFALTSYEDAAAWAETIVEAIADQRMPPWHANPDFGHFVNDARMPTDEQELIAEWVANGVPQGDPADLPTPPSFVDGWTIPEPDLVVKMPEPYTVPAAGIVEYQYFTVDPGFKEDVWVQAAEGRPGNRSVVHHLLLFYVPPGQDGFRPQDPLFNAVASFAPGLPATNAPEGYAFRIPAGSKLVFQMHYTPNGRKQVDQSQAGFVFADPKKLKKELHVGAVLDWKFRIPPGDPNYRVEASKKFEEDTELYAFVPHMHWRGKSFRVYADYKDGRSEILLDVPRYDFNWQNVYQLVEPKRMPAGSSLRCVAHFDNSKHNLVNPDPTATVTWGDQTWQEMMVGSYSYGRAEENLSLGLPQVRSVSDGRYEVRFRYRATGKAEAVYLAGAFNEWQPTGHRMDGPDEDGWFTTTIELPAGRHEYKFVVDGKTWKADPSNRERAGFYGNSVIDVGG